MNSNVFDRHGRQKKSGFLEERSQTFGFGFSVQGACVGEDSGVWESRVMKVG